MDPRPCISWSIHPLRPKSHLWRPKTQVKHRTVSKNRPLQAEQASAESEQHCTSCLAWSKIPNRIFSRPQTRCNFMLAKVLLSSKEKSDLWRPESTCDQQIMVGRRGRRGGREFWHIAWSVQHNCWLGPGRETRSVPGHCGWKSACTRWNSANFPRVLWLDNTPREEQA